MKRYSICATLLTLILGTTLSVSAQNNTLPILDITPSARALAMGSHTVGLSKGMYIYTNPASFFYNSIGNFNVSYTGQLHSSLEGAGRLQYHALGAGYKTGRHAFLAGLRYMGGLEYNLDDGTTLSPGWFTTDLTYAAKIWHGLVTSVGASFIRSKYDTSAMTVGCNASLHYGDQIAWVGRSWDYIVGASVVGVGLPLNYGDDRPKVDIPIRTDIGGEIATDIATDHRLSMAMATQLYVFPTQTQSVSVSGGMEYSFRRLCFVRGGYTHGQNDYRVASAGIGVSYRSFSIDATYHKTLIEGGIGALTISIGHSF